MGYLSIYSCYEGIHGVYSWRARLTKQDKASDHELEALCGAVWDPYDMVGLAVGVLIKSFQSYACQSSPRMHTQRRTLIQNTNN